MGSRVEEPVETRHVGQRHLDRLVMLSDGVFAIAITLSAIEIKPETASGQTLWQVWSTPLSVYFLSFFLIGVMWAGHRRIVGHLRDIDAVGTAINLLLLSLVALTPVVIRFVFAGASQNQAMLIYAIALTVTFTCMAALWGYVAFIANLAPDLALRVRRAWLMNMVGAPMLTGALVLHQLNNRWGTLALTLLGVALLVGKRVVMHRKRPD